MRKWSLAQRVLAAQWAALVLLTLVAAVSTYAHTRSVIFERTTAATTQIALLAADDPRVRAGFESSEPTAELQPLADRVMADTQMDFSTFISRDGIRLTYHRPGYVGSSYTGTLAPVWNGETVTETSSTATAGESVRSVVPVYADSRRERIVGALTIGKQVRALDVIVASDMPSVLITSGAFALVLGVGSWWGSRYLRRVTAGLGPEALSRHFAVADAALLSVDEGIVLADESGRIIFHNRAADALLGLAEAHDPARGPLDPANLGLPSPVAELIASGRRAEDEPHRVGQRVLILSQRPLSRRTAASAATRGERGAELASPAPGQQRGTVLTIHDHSAVQSLAGELASTRSLTDALRAQNHDHSNRLHTLLGLLEVQRPDEARKLLTQSLLHTRAQAGVDGADGDTVLAALAHGKIAEAAERGVDLSLALRLERGTGLPAPDLVGVFGNLLDNAVDAAAGLGASVAAVGETDGETDGDAARVGAESSEAWVRFEADVEETENGAWLVASVANGGAPPSAQVRERMFDAGYSTKPGRALGRGQGLSIVAATVARLGGRLEVAVDSGTVFTVELPLPALGPPSPVGPEPGGHGSERGPVPRNAAGPTSTPSPEQRARARTRTRTRTEEESHE